MSEAFVDPYLDPETGILRNKVGARTQSELRKIEGDIIFATEISSIQSIPRTNDINELIEIHRVLFDKVYDWAGKIRTVDLKKGSDSYFLVRTQIETGANYVFGELAKERYLVNLPLEAFADRLAYFYEQLNFVHPFREGNGRTQRIYWSRVARDAGYNIDWDKVIGHELDKATLAARETQNLTRLIEMFQKIISKA